MAYARGFAAELGTGFLLTEGFATGSSVRQNSRAAGDGCAARSRICTISLLAKLAGRYGNAQAK